MNCVHWAAAAVGLLAVVLYGYRTGWLIETGEQRSPGAVLTRCGILLVLSFLTSGLIARAVTRAPVEWFHLGLLVGLVVTDTGLLILAHSHQRTDRR